MCTCVRVRVAGEFLTVHWKEIIREWVKPWVTPAGRGRSGGRARKGERGVRRAEPARRRRRGLRRKKKEEGEEEEEKKNTKKTERRRRRKEPSAREEDKSARSRSREWGKIILN